MVFNSPMAKLYFHYSTMNAGKSAALLALADEMREVRTICHCGKKAHMVARMDETGKALREGPQILVGGNDTYISLCRKHWREAVGD